MALLTNAIIIVIYGVMDDVSRHTEQLAKAADL